MSPALAAKSGSRGKIQLRWRHGRIASSEQPAPHRVVPETVATIPRRIASRRSSPRLKRASGRPSSAGSWQASALTSTTTAGGKAAGRPPRGRSASPARPSSKKRLRQWLTSRAHLPEPPGDLVVAQPIGGEEHHPGPEDLARLAVWRRAWCSSADDPRVSTRSGRGSVSTSVPPLGGIVAPQLRRAT